MSEETKSVQTSETRRPTHIIFVCTGNTCRSVMAECIFNSAIKNNNLSGKFSISSAGLAVYYGDTINPSAVTALKMLAFGGSEHEAKLLSSEDVAAADLIVCMTAEHKKRVNSPKAVTFGEIVGCGDVPDPYGKPVSEYIEVGKLFASSVGKVLQFAVQTRLKAIKGN